MLLLQMLVACADDAADSGNLASGGCASAGDPEVTITSPESSATFVVGDTVTLEAELVGVGGLLVSWAVDNDVFATGPSASWVAEDPGDHVLQVQLEDDCGVVQDSLPFRVSE